MKITVENLNKKYAVNKKLVERIAGRVLRYLKRPRGIKLELIFLSDPAIRQLNRRYTRRDRATDVLSFLLDGVGLIYISIDRASAQSKIFGSGLTEEVVRYIIHGMLHLFGYDDLTEAGRLRMSAKEDEVLGWLSRKEDLSKVLTRL